MRALTPQQYSKIREVFTEAVELPHEKRREFLRSALDGDEALVREAESLIFAEETAGTFLGDSALTHLARGLASERIVRMRDRKIDQYRLESLLGAGGAGEVYLASDLVLNRKVAIKVLSEKYLPENRIIHRFDEEARAASALSHPNVCHIYALGETDGQHYVAMEYVEGETLRKRLSTSTVSILETVEIGIQVASALTAAHAAGIVHRDIKPENIMLRPDGFVKVLDFGLAKRVRTDALELIADGSGKAAVNTPGEILGTFAYMSPEQARGQEVDTRTDIWSLGCVLYEMVAGRPPFAGDSGPNVPIAALKQDPPPLTSFQPEVPAQLQQLISRALCRNREERWQTATEMLAELKDLRQEFSLAHGHGPAGRPHADGSTSPVAKQPLTGIRRAVRHGTMPLLLLLTGIILSAVTWYEFSDRAELPQILEIVPFTSFPGRELHPSFSPDGNLIAFAWEGEDRKDLDIYVKPIGEGRPFQLTSDPRPEFSPAFSPDGGQIAFYRVDGSGGEVVLVPTTGGPERILSRSPDSWLPAVDPRPGEPTAAGGEQRVLSWFGGGRYLAVIGRPSPDLPAAVFALSLATGELRQMTRPHPRSFGEISVAVSPSGQYLAFTRSEELRWVDPKLFWATLTKGDVGKPHALGPGSGNDQGFAWEPNGRRLLFSTPEGLHRLTLPNGTPVLIPIPGYPFAQLSISPDGRSLAFVQASWDLDIWRIKRPEIEGTTGIEPSRVISSTRFDTNPGYSPDGRRIVFTSARSGSLQIWVCDSDGSNPMQLTRFEAGTGTPRWSPDSREIAFDSVEDGTGDIYVVSADGGPTRRLGLDGSHEQRPSWSHDGLWIYFESDRSGSFELWKMPASGGTPEQVTTQGGADAAESSDGLFVYYTKINQRGIWRKPIAGGSESLVVTQGMPNLWSIYDNGLCVIDDAPGHGPSIDCLRFGSNRLSTVVKLPEKTRVNMSGPSLSASADGQSFLYVVRDREESDIMLAKNFR